MSLKCIFLENVVLLLQDFNMNGSMIVSCGMDHSLKIWKTDTEEIQNVFTESYTYNAAKADR